MDASLLTRENKIALVIGFAILLVVGVLLSDHLAQAARGGAADLASIADPLRNPPGSSIEFLPLIAGNAQEPDIEPQPPGPTEEPTRLPRHMVQTGETMTLIARRYYDDGRLAEALATYNKLPAPDRLRTGLRLLIPPRDAFHAIDPPSPPTETATQSQKPASTTQTYTVQSGDTLSELAQKLMGTAKATDRLWSMNKATLKSPDALRVGMELRYAPIATP